MLVFAREVNERARVCENRCTRRVFVFEARERIRSGKKSSDLQTKRDQRGLSKREREREW